MERRLADFRKRYPMDDRAFEYLASSHWNALERVLKDFEPGDKGIDDYSAILTTFLSKIRTRLSQHYSNRRRSDDGAWERRNDDWHDDGGWEERGGSRGGGGGDAGRDRNWHSEREESGGMRELVIRVGKRMGRSAQDVEPFIASLQQNWYDTPESLIGINDQDLTDLRIPLRFARELLNEVETDDKPPLQRTWVTPNPREADWHGGGKRSDWKGKGHRDDKGAGKGQWKGHSKGYDKGTARDEGSERKGKGRDGPSEKELAYKDLIKVDVEDRDEQEQERMRGRLRGKRDANFHFIQEQTGALVRLAGAGSGHLEPETGKESPESLHVRVMAASRGSLKRGVDMVTDLIDSIYEKEPRSDSGDPSRQRHESRRERSPRTKGSTKTGDKSKGTGSGNGRGRSPARGGRGRDEYECEPSPKRNRHE